MTKPIYTPSPWIKTNAGVSSQAGVNVAFICCNDPLLFEEAEANHYLITAAPELLEALKNSQIELGAILATATLTGLNREMIKARREANSMAILKAEGLL